MDTLNSEELLPEFSRLPALVDGVRYVIAERAHGAAEHLNIYGAHPVYVAKNDFLAFPPMGIVAAVTIGTCGFYLKNSQLLLIERGTAIDSEPPEHSKPEVRGIAHCSLS